MPEPSRVPEGFSEEAVLNPQGGEALRAAVRRWRRRFASSLGPWGVHLPALPPAPRHHPPLCAVCPSGRPPTPKHSSLPKRWGADLRVPNSAQPSPAVCVCVDSGKSFPLSELTLPICGVGRRQW